MSEIGNNMSKDIQEAIERLNRFRIIKIIYGNTFAMRLEQLNQLQEDLETVLNYIETLETATNNKYPYVIGERTLYGRLQQLDKEDLIKAYLRLRNETEQLIKETENSIPTEVIEDYLKQEQKAFDIYKKESKENENLKLGMWKHLGAKNMCERILGIEKTVITLDEDLLENK